MQPNKPQFHWFKLMHHFDRVELITFKSSGQTCTRSVWGQEDSEELSCQAEELMLHALKEEHSFVYIKSGEIRVIKAWLKDGRFISSYPEFLNLCEISLDIGEDNGSDNAYLSIFKKNMIDPRQWSKASLIRAWKDVQGVGIGAGANKEMVEVSSHGGLLPQFDLNLESLIDANTKGTNGILKTGKYLGRILRPFRYCTFDKHRINQLDADPDMYDGFSLISREFAARCGLKTEAGDRVEVTMLTGQGLIKGHGEIRNLQEDALVFGDQFKHQVQGTAVCGFEKLKKSEKVYLDIQTIINIPQLWDHIPSWIDRMMVEVLAKIRDGELPEFMSRIDELDFRNDGTLERERWVLKRLVQHEIPIIFPWMIRRIWAFYREFLLRPGVLRVRIPGAIRIYLTPDIIKEEPTVQTGRCIIRGANLYISRKDKSWICRLLGGADFDDSVVVIPIERNRVLIYRNPNQFGEWAVLDIQDSDHTFTRQHTLEQPPSQRWNEWPAGQTMEEAKERIQDFWEFMKGRPVEACLKSRVPERLRDQVEFVEGPLTELFHLAGEKISQAEEAIREYCRKVAIPELFIQRTGMYPVAKDIRSLYGKAVARLIRKAEQVEDPEERNALIRTRLEKINARVRNQLRKFTDEEKKLIVSDLAHLSYMALPGTQSKGGYTLTQANDGILGIPNSRGNRNVGTADIFIDLLLDLGFGKRIEVTKGAPEPPVIADESQDWSYDPEKDITVTRSLKPRYIPSPNGKVITLVGGWRRLAERDGLDSSRLNSFQENKFIVTAHKTLSSTNTLQIRGGNVTSNGAITAYVAKDTSIEDGIYSLQRILSGPLKSINVSVCKL